MVSVAAALNNSIAAAMTYVGTMRVPKYMSRRYAGRMLA